MVNSVWFYCAKYSLASVAIPSACCLRLLSSSLCKAISGLFTVCTLYIVLPSNKQLLQSSNVRLAATTHFFVPLQSLFCNFLSTFLYVYNTSIKTCFYTFCNVFAKMFIIYLIHKAVCVHKAGLYLPYSGSHSGTHILASCSSPILPIQGTL